MLECLEDGELRPSAQAVAERAGVSSRAVFRHFQNMESLFEEVSELQIERVLGALPPLVTEGSRDARIEAMVDRSARANERVAPVRRAALLSEPFSAVIRERFAWMRSGLRRQVRRVFRVELAALGEAERRECVAGLCAALSFSHWEELRRHEGLSDGAARRVLTKAMRSSLHCSR